MAASALFILDLKGRVILSRDYRGDVSAKSIERFISKVSELEETGRELQFARLDSQNIAQRSHALEGTPLVRETLCTPYQFAMKRALLHSTAADWRPSLLFTNTRKLKIVCFHECHTCFVADGGRTYNLKTLQGYHESAA